MLTREPNPEGKGGIEMIDLLVNSLRMRPDRILVGEVRRQREAEVLFEAMHTGHSVYATVHADNSSECITRLTTPPINLPKPVIPALGGIVVQYRNRRTGFRRTLQFAEVTKEGEARDLYLWDPREDKMNEVAEPERLIEQLGLYTGMTQKEMNADLAEKTAVLKWMVQKRYLNTDIVGKITADYYSVPEEVADAAKKGKDWS
jgi:flagellar protein FlaI